jgi:hypothetical protein
MFARGSSSWRSTRMQNGLDPTVALSVATIDRLILSVETEAILRRFTRNNVQHPTYSLSLPLPAQRGATTRHPGRAMENDFAYFARRGEMTGNRPRRSRDQRSGGAPVAELHGVREHADATRDPGPAPLAGSINRDRPPGPNAVNLGACQPLRPVRPRYCRHGCRSNDPYGAAGDTIVGSSYFLAMTRASSRVCALVRSSSN